MAVDNICLSYGPSSNASKCIGELVLWLCHVLIPGNLVRISENYQRIPKIIKEINKTKRIIRHFNGIIRNSKKSSEISKNHQVFQKKIRDFQKSCGDFPRIKLASKISDSASKFEAGMMHQNL